MGVRAILLVTAALLVYASDLRAQNAGPLGDLTAIWNGEIVVTWGQNLGQGNANMDSRQKIYDFYDIGVPDSARLLPRKRQILAGTRGVFGNSNMMIATGDFNGDSFSDIVSVWEGNNNSISVFLPKIQRSTLDYDSLNSRFLTITGPLPSSTGSGNNRRVLVATGDFDGDTQDEFVVVYQGSDFKIHLQVYDTDGGSSVFARASIDDEALPQTLASNLTPQIAVATGDFNKDGKTDIALLSVDPNANGTGQWGIYVKLYEVSGTGSSTITARARQIIGSRPSSSVYVMNLVAAAGDVDKDGAKEIAAAYRLSMQDQNGDPVDSSFVCMLKANGTLSALSYNPANRIKLSANGGAHRIAIASGDLTADRRDEVVFANGGQVYAYRYSDQLQATQLAQGGGGFTGTEDYLYGNNYLAVGYVTQEDSADIVLVENYYSGDPGSNQTLNVSLLGLKGSSLALRVKKISEESAPDGGGNLFRTLAVAIGDFDGNRIRIDPARHSIKTGIVQPLVILNAPPTHYDILNALTYDLNQCFAGGCPAFNSSYAVTQTTEVQVETEVRSDWGVSTTLGGGGSVFGVTLSASLTAKYGEGFSKGGSSTTTVKVTSERQAQIDDWIYATVMDYDVWEYPVYAEGVSQGYALAVVPNLATKQNRWFSSKEWTAFTYVPNHEVGNVLSYEEYSDLATNTAVDTVLKKADGYGVSTSGSGSFSLEFSDFTTKNLRKTQKIEAEVGAKVGGYGMELEVKGNYSKEQISTHKSSVGNNLKIGVSLGSIAGSVSEGSYTITPYTYWAKNGALVVDYAVNVEQPVPGGTNTFWSAKYGTDSDPAFILPWRYDPEKGLTLQDPAKRFQTKEITFSPSTPKPGDTLTISARVHNFSLVNTPSSVGVRFYVGDPDAGGTVIRGINGDTIVTTAGSIAARKSKSVSLNWKIPGNIAQGANIYGRIVSGFTEIHPDNNKGWNILLLGAVNAVDGSGADVPTSFTLSQNYPNPFNPATIIRYQLPAGERVRLSVFDLLGREVRVLVDERQSAGTYDVRFDASGLSSGTYVYRIVAGPHVRTQRMVLVR
jgi:hypothetical protein